MDRKLRQPEDSTVLADGFHAAELFFERDEAFGGEGVGVAERWEEDAPGAGNGDAGNAADDDGADGSPPVGGEAALVLADLVGDAMKSQLMLETRPRISGGVASCRMLDPDNHRNHVGRADDDECDAAEHDVTAEAEDDRRDPEDADADEHGFAGAALDRIDEQGERDDERSKRRMARSRPSPLAPECRMSTAKMGMSEAAPPSRTAKRSSEMEPSRRRVPIT